MSTSPKLSSRKYASSTLPRSRYSSSTLKKMKDLSMDEGCALDNMQKLADKNDEDQRNKEALAMKYWEEKKKEEQEKFSDEENDHISSRFSRSPRNRSRGSKSGSDLVVSDFQSYTARGNGIETIKVWQEKFHDTERQLKESMLSNAQLYKEKTALVFQVESLKDRLEDSTQDFIDLKADLSREQSNGLHHEHRTSTLNSEITSLKKQITFRDEFLERLGLHLPTGDEGDDMQSLILPAPEMDPEEKEKLMKEIETLKEEIASMKKSSVLGDQQPRDIVQVSTKLVSEYKAKVQIAEAENNRLDSMVTRLRSQVTRYKNQVKELEEREDELMKEKRHQAKDIRSLQSESEDQKTEIDLMRKRIEQLKKRRDYGSES